MIIDVVRREDWRERLIAHVEAYRAAGFDWRAGRHCVAFVLEACIAMTGEEPFEGGWRAPRSEAAAARWLRRRGFDDGAAFAACWFEPIEPAFARDGDIAIVKAAQGRACGLFLGTEIAGLDPAGLVLVPRDYALAAARIG